MKIICIGRNYADHARELNNKVPSEPMFFLKPDSAILPHRHPLFIPDWTDDMHYEVELVIRITRLGKHVSKKFAHRYFSEVGVGIDFTARDVQQVCKEKGWPWEKAKAFDGSAALSRHFEPLKELGGDIQDVKFSLKKNGEVVQDGHSGDMIFPVDEIIAHVSRFMTLKMGDLIYTGTPAGVGKVVSGDVLEAFIGENNLLKVRVK
jgi:acylpyruvate hydrolase